MRIGFTNMTYSESAQSTDQPVVIAENSVPFQPEQPEQPEAEEKKPFPWWLLIVAGVILWSS
jgi:hypothetical protein